MLFNPHELPCGNISCLDCIYDNYNLFTNEFKCPFEKCKSRSHLLKNQFVKLNIIENNIGEICGNQIDYLNKSLSNLSFTYGISLNFHLKKSLFY